MIVNRVSIQGQKASFHDLAAQKFFDNSDIIECDSFKETITKLINKECRYSLVAIENSLYGTINEVYDLILNNPVVICGEVYLKIEQNLIGLPDSELNDIKEIYSHPVALAQCEEFLDKYLPISKRYETHDTAGSVAEIKEWDDKSKAAIASKQAAKKYSLKILSTSIETNKHNYTRFVILERSKDSKVEDNSNKASLVLQTKDDDKAGSLVKVLNIFAENNINVTALHSRPIIGRAWHYMFYVDIKVEYKDSAYTKILKNINQTGCQVHILGNYKEGRTN